MDYRPEPHLKPLPEEKLPPKPPRIVWPREQVQRRPAMLASGVLALVVLGVAGSLLIVLTRPGPMAGSKTGGPGSASQLTVPAVDRATPHEGAAPTNDAKPEEPKPKDDPEIALMDDPKTGEESTTGEGPNDGEPKKILKSASSTEEDKAKGSISSPPAEKPKRPRLFGKPKKKPIFTYPKRESWNSQESRTKTDPSSNSP